MLHHETSLYKNCLLCPRLCGADRESGQRGFCGETAALRISYAGLYNGEEPPIKGDGGSGAIFVSGCNVGCVFCQCFQVSQGNNLPSADPSPRAAIRTVDTAEFAELCLSLQEMGAENINIVTGSHAAPALVQGITAARAQGLAIPALWNSSGYEGAATLDLLKDCIDVYMPDLKTLDPAIGLKFSRSADYPEHAAAAILKMMQYRPLRFGPSLGKSGAQEVIHSGVIIRHLIIPGFLENTRQVIRWFAENCNAKDASGQSRALLSILAQYTPAQIPGVKTPIPNRCVSTAEYEAVLAMLDEFGITDGFCQELVTATKWLPDFSRQNPFPAGISVPVRG